MGHCNDLPDWKPTAQPQTAIRVIYCRKCGLPKAVQHHVIPHCRRCGVSVFTTEKPLPVLTSDDRLFLESLHIQPWL